jgi:hypothetical protein
VKDGGKTTHAALSMREEGKDGEGQGGTGRG